MEANKGADALYLTYLRNNELCCL